MFDLRPLICIILSSVFTLMSSACTGNPDTEATPPPPVYEEQPAQDQTSLIITVGDASFSAEIYDTPTSVHLLSMLPLTLEMSELNGNEKYFQFSDDLPTSPEAVGSIRKGDLMLYQSDYLVLFYDSFDTSYSYTPIGHVENTDGLYEALGAGNPTVTFSISK